MPQIDITLKSSADVGGFNQTSAKAQELQRILGRFGNNVFQPLITSVESADRTVQTRMSGWERTWTQIQRKFSGSDMGKQLLGALGIGSGIALAEQAARLIAGHWERAANAAEKVAAASERQLTAVRSRISLEQSDPERLQTIMREQSAEQKQRADLLAKAQQVIRTPIQRRSPDGGWVETGQVSERQRGLTDAEREEVARLDAAIQERDLRIAELRKRIEQQDLERTMKLAEDSAAADGRTPKAKLDYEGVAEAQAAGAAALEAWNAEMETAAQRFKELGDSTEKYKRDIEEVNLLERMQKLTAQEASAARARIAAEMNDTAGKAIRSARDELAKFDAALAMISANPALTDNERHQQRLKVLNDQVEAIARLRKALTDFQAAHPGVDVGAISSAIRDLDKESAQAKADMTPRASKFQQTQTAYRESQQEGFQTVGEGVQGGFLGYMTQLGTMADQVAAGIQNTLGAAVNGITQGIMGWINGTMTFRQALANIGQSVLQTILQTLVQMGVRMVLNAALSRVLTAASAAAAVAIATPTALALSGIWAGPATLATIATLGGAAAQAPVSVLAAKGTILAQSIAGFADGVANIQGPGTSTSDSILARLSRGESVLTARTTAFLGEDFINQLNADPMRAIARPYQAGASAGGSSASTASTQRGQAVIVVNSREEAMRWMMRHPEFEAQIVDINQRRRGEFLET
jgi:hypothetical protein